MNGLLSDLRYAARQFAVAPGIHVAAVVILAIGTALTITIYSVVRSAVLEQLPYPDAGRLYGAWEIRTGNDGVDTARVAPPVLDAWRTRAQEFEGIAALLHGSFAMIGAGEPLRAEGYSATWSLLEMLAARFEVGRGYTREEDRPGGAAVLVVSNEFWRVHLGGRPDVLGHRLLLDGEPFEIVGVTDAAFELPGGSFDFIMPLGRRATEAFAGAKFLDVIAKLRDGVEAERAQSALSALSARVPDNEGWSAALVPLREQVTGSAKNALVLLLAAVIAVLLIACANATNLLIARTPERTRELAIRAALGASRARLMRLALLDAMLLAVIAGVLGIVLALWATDVIVAISPDTLPRRSSVDIDAGVVTFAVALVALCSLAVGAIPALLVAMPRLLDHMRDASRTATSGRGRAIVRRILVTAEVALMAILIAGASLLIRSFNRIMAMDPGFQVEQLVAVDMFLPGHRYGANEDRVRFGDRLLDQVNTIPGVTAAALTTNLPITRNIQAPLEIEGRTRAPGEPRLSAALARVTPGYLAAMQMDLVAGRWFDERDDGVDVRVAVISESLARTVYGSENPVGRRARTLFGPGMREIIGVVSDVRHSGLTSPHAAVFYEPFVQQPLPFFHLIVRSQRPVDVVTSDVAAAIRSIDPEQPITMSASMADLIGRSVAMPRFLATLLTVFAGASFALALAGIYAVMAAIVAERRREIGIRVTLGARAADLTRLIGANAVSFVAVGLLIGSLSAIALTRVMQSLLFGVTPSDMATHTAVALLVLFAAVAGTAVPLRRALRIEPAEIIREL